ADMDADVMDTPGSTRTVTSACRGWSDSGARSACSTSRPYRSRHAAMRSCSAKSPKENRESATWSAVEVIGYSLAVSTGVAERGDPVHGKKHTRCTSF